MDIRGQQEVGYVVTLSEEADAVRDASGASANRKVRSVPQLAGPLRPADYPTDPIGLSVKAG